MPKTVRFVVVALIALSSVFIAGTVTIGTLYGWDRDPRDVLRQIQGDASEEPAKKLQPLPAKSVAALESGLNSRTKEGQAATLVSDLRDGKWDPAKVLPEGAKLSIQPGTFRKTEQGDYVVNATVSGSRVANFQLHLVQEKGSWLVYRTEQVSGKQPSASAVSVAVSDDAGLDFAPVAHSRPLAESGGCSATKGKTPVLLVHGLHSNGDMWGNLADEHSMRSVLDAIDGLDVDVFDYKEYHSEWVDNPNIGPKLAERISCLYAVSGKKVVVVAHSMGGLATRYALAQNVTARKVGLVITMGTPHLGSAWADQCTWMTDARCVGSAPIALMQDSPALRDLPKFPEGLPVRAIAGDVTVEYNLLFASAEQHTEGDRVVSVASATAHYTDTGMGDGKWIYPCRGTSPFPGSDAPCDHNEMVKAPYAQKRVTEGIESYLVATKATMRKVYGLSIPMQRNWAVTYQDARTTVIRDTASCDTQLDESMEPYRAQIEKDKLWCAGMAIMNLAALPGEAADGVTCESYSSPSSTSVGGAVANYTTGHGCSNGIVVGSSSLRTWNVPSKKVMIDVYDLPGKPFHGVDGVLTELRWS